MPSNEQNPLLGGSIKEEEEPSSLSVRQWVVDFYHDNRFLVHIATVILLAKLYPPLGAVYVYPSITATWLAVIFIFTMAGLSLKSKELLGALNNIGFNLFVQVFNFGFVSSLVFGVSRVLLHWDLLSSRGLADGMVIGSCMPVTVTMMLVLTRSANGDEASAVLNAALGSLLGVCVSPFLILAYIGVEADVDIVSVIIKLCLRVLVPLSFGQILQQTSRGAMEFVKTHKQTFKTCQEWALVFIVYTAYCKCFTSSSSSTQSSSLGIEWTSIVVMVVAEVGCLVFCMYVAWMVLRAVWRDEPKLRVMGLYGCTHKSVVMGIPILNAVYENDPRLALYILPMFVWHPAQLTIGSWLAPQLAEGVDNIGTHLGLSASTRELQGRMSFFQPRPEKMKRESFASFELDD